MLAHQSLILGIKSSGGYFISTFLFGVMFGIAASSVELEAMLALLMSGSVFSASAQFAALEFWYSPLPLGTILLSVFLVSTRNILLGMSQANHFDGHSLSKRIVSLFILNDPGVVTVQRLPQQVDRLEYIVGYGLSLMASWLLSTALGVAISGFFRQANLGSLSFAGPLVMVTMMILFIKGSKTWPGSWIASGVIALLLYELGLQAYLILVFSVFAGALLAVVKENYFP